MHMDTPVSLPERSVQRPAPPWLRCYLRLPIPPSSYFVMIAAYLLCNEYNAGYASNWAGDQVLATELDRAIPFLPWTIFAYIANFAFYLLPRPLLLQGEPGWMAYGSINRALLMLTLTSCALFLLFPSSVEMRAEALASVDRSAYPAWLLDACAALYTVDHSFNAWPSLHISQPLLILLALQQTGLYSVQQTRFNWACFVAVSLSVLTMKQHYLWDVASGALLALVVWWFSLRAVLAEPASRDVMGRTFGGAA